MKVYAVIGVSNVDGMLNNHIELCKSYRSAKKIFNDWIRQDEEVYADKRKDFIVTKSERSYEAYEDEKFSETCVSIEIKKLEVRD